MRLESKHVVYGIYVVVFGVGVLLSALVNLQGRGAAEVALHLTARDIPILRTLSDLKTEVVALEPIVYQYYAFRDHAKFERQLLANTQSISEGMREIRAAFPDNPLVAEIEAEYGPIQAHVRDLRVLLRYGDADRDEAAHALLFQISGLCSQINANLDRLAQSVHSDVAARGKETERRIVGITFTVALFSGLLFVVVLIAGYFARAFLAEGAARRRLSMFPERNPNPVVSLTRDGWVEYGNPGAREALTRLGADSADPLRLLPPDLPLRLAALAASGSGHEWWEYPALGRVFGCGIHFLEDYGVFHAYLSDLTERKRAEEQLVYQAYHDALTGLPNRRMFREQLVQTLRAGPARAAAVMLLTADRFSQVTESLGQDVGDSLLQAVAERLERVLDQCSAICGNATLYRFEGNLFAVLVAEPPFADAPARLAGKIGAAMEEVLPVGGRDLFAALSIGLSLYPTDGADADTLLKNAESALHSAQQAGGRAFRCYAQEMNARALERLELEHDLRLALGRSELEIHYQPQVDIATSRIVGAEALLRWRHPTRGMIAPGEFIALAEESGLIVPIGEWVLRRVCEQNRVWHRAGFAGLRVAVNLSARQFQSEGMPQLVRRVLKDTGLPAPALELEVTESIAMRDVELTVATLRELKHLGARLSIDDFGTGYSSLSYLKRFPLDTLKVDQSFVRDLTTDANDATIAQAVVALGHSLKLNVIAEGVETAAQFALLTHYGCDEIQGYLASPPLPPENFVRLLSADMVLPNVPWTAASRRSGRKKLR